MKFTDFEAQKDDSDRRLDRVLKRILSEENPTLGNIFRLIRKNLIYLNGSKTHPDIKIKEGDIISVASFLLSSSTGETLRSKTTYKDETKEDIIKKFDVKTVFKNEHLWIINKAAGVSVQPEKGKDFCLSNFVSSQTPNNSLSFRVGPLHRIDKPVTGLVVFSQSLEGAKWFSHNLKNKTIKRIYLAIVENSFPSTPLIFNSPIEGKDAETKVQLLSYGELNGKKVSLVKAEIMTGRKHQIRYHLSSSGYPIIGDTRFGFHEKSSANILLHAWKLFFPYPNKIGLPKEITACPPETFTKIFAPVLKNQGSDFII